MVHGIGIVAAIVEHLAHGKMDGHAIGIRHIAALQYGIHAPQNGVVRGGILPAMRQAVPVFAGVRRVLQGGFEMRCRVAEAALIIKHAGQHAICRAVARVARHGLAGPVFGGRHVATLQLGICPEQAGGGGARPGVGGAVETIARLLGPAVKRVKLAEADLHIGQVRRQFNGAPVRADRVLVLVQPVVRGAQIPVRRGGVRFQPGRLEQDCAGVGEAAAPRQRRAERVVGLEMGWIRLDRTKQ